MIYIIYSSLEEGNVIQSLMSALCCMVFDR